ncbi:MULTISPECIES: class I SAM-dependent methyltransferase [Paenibacillus]|jgi:ubiquinone/menaquinone biosynthesis C-methylase UbiE|uniref:class I SAM-dependent methyltransferase n=1 Tax=Paenibacillus TaxID=44249 RepID=UPI00083D66BA|nr:MULTISPECIES: class I SAM-dependent methyltransferase [Paenibacillus]MBP1173304.1 ubiquinone/menaquinone biosynthesis C-methylase UbiE [Paenibacillus sp. PvR133]MXO77308.1 methyltransferase domain-containing protein [Paenibacillus sp. OT2-17]ODB59009.1 hypothetical protein A7309_04385 [Paenibacillus polymyxa]OMF36041.1 hypothetical protein BK134_00100 [Paenibacillus peoriae]VUG04434.1 Ubiquinone/menaquinone biosynthesis C-methyltransferase UbiE [Paenibacillus polymyxa]
MNDLFKQIYPIHEGIYLCSESGHYYSDLDNKRMSKLVAECISKGWRTAVKENFYDNPFLFNIITDESRADWQYLLPLTEDSVALDIGAGWGTISIPLARNIKHVVALDGTLDRLQFLSTRAKQENIENITVIHADIFKHPFKEASFDLVSFNGVLEWVGLNDLGQNPQERQNEALRIAYSLLKPGGYLYIGIENALGLKYLLGEPDDHTGIKYISYLSREEANEISLKWNKNEYSTYTYTKQGYQQLLEISGFSNIDFFYPHPDYKRIEFLYSLSEKNVSSYLVEFLRYTKSSSSISERVNDLEKFLIEYEQLSPFPASYSIFARKEEN